MTALPYLQGGHTVTGCTLISPLERACCWDEGTAIPKHWLCRVAVVVPLDMTLPHEKLA